MLRIKDKRRVALLLISVIVFSFFLPLIRKHIVDLTEYPFKITNFFINEFKIIILSHYNFLENIKLTQKIDSLQQKILGMEELISENKRLKSLLSFKQDSNFRVLAARVIMRSPENWSSLIIIDRGKVDGLKENLPVITPLGLVGRIAEVGSFTAKVTLINDPSFCVSAIIQSSRQQGLVCGTLEEYLVMRYLDETSQINIKDKVITAGLTEIFPKGILIGEVIDIKSNPHEGSTYLKIKPTVDFNKLEEVLVILK